MERSKQRLSAWNPGQNGLAQRRDQSSRVQLTEGNPRRLLTGCFGSIWPVRQASANDRYLRTPVIHCVPSSLRRLRTAEIRTRSKRESEMLRVVLNAWVTKTTAAEIWRIPRPEGVKSR